MGAAFTPVLSGFQMGWPKSEKKSYQGILFQFHCQLSSRGPAAPAAGHATGRLRVSKHIHGKQANAPPRNNPNFYPFSAFLARPSDSGLPVLRMCKHARTGSVVLLSLGPRIRLGDSMEAGILYWQLLRPAPFNAVLVFQKRCCSSQ